MLSSGELGPRGEVAHAIAEHPATMWITAYKALCQLAELADKHNIVYSLENLNTKVDHPGYPLRHIEDVVRLIAEVNSPRIRLLFDVYHAQIEEGNVIELIRKYGSYIGYVHFADVPGRHEPGTGEINYTKVVCALREIGYEGIVGLEAYPEQGDMEAMACFRKLFA
jgi:hydroxypyruvate isomerase